MRAALTFLAALILTACTPGVAELAQAPAPLQPKFTLDLAPGPCQVAGGTMTKVCRRQTERCVVPYADAGKRCTDGDQCQGDCLLAGEAKPGENLVGTCQKDTNPCGCFTPLIDGKISDRARCVD